MKNFLLSTFIVIASFIFQSTFFQFFAFGNIVPNLLIIIVSYFGFLQGKKYGILSGFFLGLLVDIFFFGILGIHALIYMYIGFFNGFFKRMVYRDDLKLHILLVGCSDIAYNIIYYILMYMLRGRFHVSFYFFNIILPEVVYTVLLTIVIFFILMLFDKIFGHLDRKSSNEIV